MARYALRLPDLLLLCHEQFHVQSISLLFHEQSVSEGGETCPLIDAVRRLDFVMVSVASFVSARACRGRRKRPTKPERPAEVSPSPRHSAPSTRPIARAERSA